MAFKEPGDSLLPLLKPAIDPYLEQDLSNLQDYQPISLKSILILFSHLLLRLLKSLFPSGFPTETLYAFQDYSIRAIRPVHLSRLDSSFLITLGEETKHMGQNFVSLTPKYF